ncbi:hypothetical protein BYT27DRAFT_6938936 [Phlegmacium glaucopus]|nr:hypothetical protein BYT27DRAFT_6938936 [Phlegmacium glaucopus]
MLAVIYGLQVSDLIIIATPTSHITTTQLLIYVLGGSQILHSNLSHIGAQPQQMALYGAPQIPFVPLGGVPGSATGSDYGHIPMAMMPRLGYQNTGSMYSMMPPMPFVPRNTVMSGMNIFGSGGSMNGSQAGGVPPSLPPLGGGLKQRPMSTFSMATSVNPFAGPSMNPNLRMGCSSQLPAHPESNHCY